MYPPEPTLSIEEFAVLGIKKITLGVATGAVCIAAVSGCGLDRSAAPERLPQGYGLIQKDQYQALHGPKGRLERLLQDRNRDGIADAVISFHPNGKPSRGELDLDADGRIDRIEVFRTDGSLERVEIVRAGERASVPDGGRDSGSVPAGSLR